MANPQIVTVPLPNTPGTLSAVAKILANEKINLDAIECTTVG